MVVKEEQERVRALLSDTITLLCRNGLTYKTEFNISALIGITLDKDDVFLVDIRETIKNAVEEDDHSKSESEEEAAVIQTSKHSSRKRRKYQSSSERPSSQEQCSEPPLIKHTGDIVKSEQQQEQEEEDADIVVIKDEPADNLDLSHLNAVNSPEQFAPLTQQYLEPVLSAGGNQSMSWDPSSLPPGLPSPTALLQSPQSQGCAVGAHTWRRRSSKHASSQVAVCGVPGHEGLVYGCVACRITMCVDCHAASAEEKAALANPASSSSSSSPSALPTTLSSSAIAKKAEVDRHALLAHYEANKRKRTFQESWRNEYFWVEYRDGYMYCGVCCGYDTGDNQGPFITGCNTFRKDSLKAHEKSAAHRNNVVKWSTRSDSQSNDADINNIAGNTTTATSTTTNITHFMEGNMESNTETREAESSNLLSQISDSDQITELSVEDFKGENMNL